MHAKATTGETKQQEEESKTTKSFSAVPSFRARCVMTLNSEVLLWRISSGLDDLPRIMLWAGANTRIGEGELDPDYQAWCTTRTNRALCKRNLCD